MIVIVILTRGKYHEVESVWPVSVLWPGRAASTSPIKTYRPYFLHKKPNLFFKIFQNFLKLRFPRKAMLLFYGRNVAADDDTKTLYIILDATGFLENGGRQMPVPPVACRPP